MQVNMIQRRTLLAGLLSLSACSSVDSPRPPAPRTLQDVEFSVPDWLQPEPGQRVVTRGADFERFSRAYDKVLAPMKLQPRKATRAVVIANELFAYSSVGEHFFISRPVLELCENDGQLLAILAQRYAASIRFNFPERSDAYKLPLNQHLAGDLWLDQMKLADTFALVILRDSGYDPRELTAIWQRIGMRDEGGQAGFAGRLRAIAEQLREMGYVA
jgi:hypothetical protein